MYMRSIAWILFPEGHPQNNDIAVTNHDITGDLWLVGLVASPTTPGKNSQCIEAHPPHSCVRYSLPSSGSREEWRYIRALTEYEASRARKLQIFGTEKVPTDLVDRAKLFDPHQMPKNEEFYLGIDIPPNATKLKHEAFRLSLHDTPSEALYLAEADYQKIQEEAPDEVAKYRKMLEEVPDKNLHL